MDELEAATLHLQIDHTMKTIGGLLNEAGIKPGALTTFALVSLAAFAEISCERPREDFVTMCGTMFDAVKRAADAKPPD